MIDKELVNEIIEACELGQKLAEELLRITGFSTIYHLDIRATKEKIERVLSKAKEARR